MKNLKIFTIIFVLIMPTSFLSCSNWDDERELTAGELIADELQDVVDEYNVHQVHIIEADGDRFFSDLDAFDFSGQFITIYETTDGPIDQESFNLNYLIKYEICEFPIDHYYLELYF